MSQVQETQTETQIPILPPPLMKKEKIGNYEVVVEGRRYAVVWRTHLGFDINLEIIAEIKKVEEDRKIQLYFEKFSDVIKAYDYDYNVQRIAEEIVESEIKLLKRIEESLNKMMTFIKFVDTNNFILRFQEDP